MTRPPLHVAVDANVLVLKHGGIPRYIRRVAEELVTGGDRVDLLANLWAWDAGVPGARSVGLRVKGLSNWRNVGIPAWCALRRPDVLWAPETVLPWRAHLPTVSTVHDLAPLLFPESKEPEQLEAYRTSFPRSVRAATLTICVSQATARDVERAWGVPRSRLRVVSNGVDKQWSPGDRAEAVAEVARRHGVNAPFVVHVGTLEPRKGLDVLIEAAREAPWQLVLVGGLGYDGERLAALARDVGAHVLTGVDDSELLTLLRAAEAVAAPAIYEGFGIVPLEAMACGTPAVISAGAGALEEVSGAAAVVVGQRTPEAWREGIADARARRAELVPAGLEHAARFTWASVAEQTRAVLGEAAGHRRR